MKLLHVDASILGQSSVSRQLSAAVVERLRQRSPELAVIYDDLGASPPPGTSPRSRPCSRPWRADSGRWMTF